MKQTLLFLAGLFLLAGSVKAEEIAVPIHTTCAIPKGVVHQVTGAGVWQDKDKMVWAIRISKLATLAKGNNFLVGIYSDTDNNRATGRFPNQAGWDMQINVNVSKKAIDVTHWLGNKLTANKPLYVDDYLVEIQGDILYIAIRKEPISGIPFGDTPSCRVIGGAIGMPLGRIDHRLNLKKSSGVFEPKLDFVRFGGDRQILHKKAEAILIPRKDSLQVWNTFGERYQEEEKLPKMIGKAPALEISGARGEAESAFFSVSGAKPFDSFVITPSALKNKAGKVIPASALAVKYIAFAGSRREDFYTDILLPAYQKSRSKNHFAAVQVNIPRGIPAGIYKGTLGVTVNGKKVEGIPFAVEVFDFDMPDRPFFKTAYCIKSGHVRKYFEEKKMGAALHSKEVRGQFQLAKEYRFSPRLILFGPKRTYKDGRLTVDWKSFDKKIHDYFNVDKFTFFQDSTFQLGSHSRYLQKYKKLNNGKELVYPSAEYDNLLGQLIKANYDHYKELGILDKVAFIFWDEPYDSVYPQIIHSIKLAKKNAPGLEAGVFIAHLSPKLAPYIDVWFTFLGTVAQLRSNPKTRNKRAWAYNEVGMGNFRAPASVPRLYYWLAENYRIEGYLYSEINVYHPQKGSKRSDLYYNHWNNHSWFYPSGIVGKPAASLRMELTRDGLDDYDYMALYKKYSGKPLPAYIKNVLPTMDKTGIITFKVGSNRELQELRNKLGREIAKLKKSK